jgi:hypothetical protein
LPTIWCAISGHGFGHAAQVVPVLNELGRLVPGIAAFLRTTVPGSFFHDRLLIPWSLETVQQDVGCIQKGPLDIDVPATWEAHRTFHATWESRLDVEMASMRVIGPDLIVADTPYLALSAGRHARIPTALLANFTWSDVLPSLGNSISEHESLLQSIEHSYADADIGLRIAPGLPLSGVRKVMNIGAIAEPASAQRDGLRSRLGMKASERLVLVGFGGIPLESLPWQHMAQMDGFRFIVDGTSPGCSTRIHPLSTLPFSFKTALASVDVVMTKPGYGTIVEAVALGLPVVYVRRYNFADEAPLVEFLHAFGQGVELSRQDFISGHWRPALEAVNTGRPSTTRPSTSGAAEAAKVLAEYFH